VGEGSLGGLAPKPSGVETGGSGGSMNRWARAPSSSGPDWGHKKLQTCVKWHTCTVHGKVFNSRRGHLRTQKTTKLLAAAGPHWGSLHRPHAGPLSALRASSFRPLGRSNRGPPSYCWTRAHQGLATPLPKPLIVDNIFQNWIRT